MYISKVYSAAVDSYGDVRTLVRGLPYQCPDDWEVVLDSLDENSNLYLIKEPDNPKDKHAIAAYLDNRRIGYVASSDCGKIWLYLTDEQMPCKFIQRYDASFKISFDNPRSQFEDIPFKEIYRDTFGISEQPNPAFEIPFLNNPKDDHYIWFDDKILIGDFERAIPNFRRKLATLMIIFAGRKNSKGEYCYYLPFCNRPIADIEDGAVKNLVDKYGFVIALPDVPMITQQDIIIMDLHVTYLSKTNYKDFDLANQSELVFSLTKDYDVRSLTAANNQTIASIDKKNNDSQDIAIDEDDMFMQDSRSTPSYSKSDYILKKGEVIISSIDKKTFIKIDKITSDLFTFVRKTLFPSSELFSYLKKRTPYYAQFYDFGQFETLIRVFVIKDLGRIYKGLNHSFNIDTAEGKALFLYMEKDTGENPETSYESFNEICNPRTRLEAASKMHELIENLMKSFYEYDIALWTETDFMIHSFLKDVDDELAKRYMELMRQFASVVTGANEQTLITSIHKFEYSETDEKTPADQDHEEEYYSVTDSPEGGKHVSMGVIVPEDGDEDFDFCSYECSIRDEKQIEIITKYMKRFEEGQEPRAFLMIGRPLLGTSDMYIFYSLDGEIIFNFIFDEKIKGWIKDAGFVLGKVTSYNFDKYLPERLNITLSVSKRKGGETLFKQASEEAMDYIEETTESTADYKLEGKIIDAVNDYLNGISKEPYKVLVIPKNGYAVYTTLKGKEIAIAFDYEIQQLAEDNKGAVGYITNFEYDDDEINVEFTIRVSRSIPRITLD